MRILKLDSHTFQGDYVSSFQGLHGDQWVFVKWRGDIEVSGSEIGWQTRYGHLRMRELVLDPTEQSWLWACLKAVGEDKFAAELATLWFQVLVSRKAVRRKRETTEYTAESTTLLGFAKSLWPCPNPQTHAQAMKAGEWCFGGCARVPAGYVIRLEDGFEVRAMTKNRKVAEISDRIYISEQGPLTVLDPYEREPRSISPDDLGVVIAAPSGLEEVEAER